jgi:hypothetical protein
MSMDSRTTSIPIVLSLVSVLLVIDGVLALYGSLAYTGHATDRVYDAVGSAVILLCGFTIWINHRSALWLTLLCVLVLTVDEGRQITAVFRVNGSMQTIGAMWRSLLNILLYWAAYLAYRRWKRARSSR